jgi:hypothetical protein
MTAETSFDVIVTWFNRIVVSLCNTKPPLTLTDAQPVVQWIGLGLDCRGESASAAVGITPHHYACTFITTSILRANGYAPQGPSQQLIRDERHNATRW